MRTEHYIKDSSTKSLEHLLMNQGCLSKEYLMEIKQIINRRYDRKHNKQLREKDVNKSLRKYNK